MSTYCQSKLYVMDCFTLTFILYTNPLHSTKALFNPMLSFYSSRTSSLPFPLLISASTLVYLDWTVCRCLNIHPLQRLPQIMLPWNYNWPLTTAPEGWVAKERLMRYRSGSSIDDPLNFSTDKAALWAASVWVAAAISNSWGLDED